MSRKSENGYRNATEDLISNNLVELCACLLHLLSPSGEPILGPGTGARSVWHHYFINGMHTKELGPAPRTPLGFCLLSLISSKINKLIN